VRHERDALDRRAARGARKEEGGCSRKSLNQVIREYLERLAGGDDPERDIKELEHLSAKGRGRSRGWKFDREELHERS
jgi:hypothetical protein